MLEAKKRSWIQVHRNTFFYVHFCLSKKWKLGDRASSKFHINSSSNLLNKAERKRKITMLQKLALTIHTWLASLKASHFIFNTMNSIERLFKCTQRNLVMVEGDRSFLHDLQCTSVQLVEPLRLLTSIRALSLVVVSV